MFGNLVVHLAGRFDLICFKLYAAADASPGSKHVQDLFALEPTSDELQRAATWVKAQDAGAEFPSFVDAVIAHIEAHDAGR